jgi:hypothetical protein
MPSSEPLRCPRAHFTDPATWTEADIVSLSRHLRPQDEQRMLQEFNVIEKRYVLENQERLRAIQQEAQQCALDAEHEIQATANLIAAASARLSEGFASRLPVLLERKVSL